MRDALLTLMLLVPLVAVGQAPGDTVQVVVPEDRNCADFVSQQQAQGGYDALRIITGTKDANRLDSDSDGQPCEGLTYGKIEHVGDGYMIRYELVPREVECPAIDPFTISGYQGVARKAIRDSVGYLAGTGVGIWNAMDCLHSIGVIRQAN